MQSLQDLCEEVLLHNKDSLLTSGTRVRRSAVPDNIFAEFRYERPFLEDSSLFNGVSMLLAYIIGQDNPDLIPHFQNLLPPCEEVLVLECYCYMRHAVVPTRFKHRVAREVLGWANMAQAYVLSIIKGKKKFQTFIEDTLFAN